MRYNRDQVARAIRKVLYEEEQAAQSQNNPNDPNAQIAAIQAQQAWQEQLATIPSPIKVGQQVLLDFGDDGQLKNFTVKCVDFSADGIKYTCVNPMGAVIHRISSQFVKGLV